MSKKNTERYTPEFKARVALEAAREQESLAQIGHRYGAIPSWSASGRRSCSVVRRMPFAGVVPITKRRRRKTSCSRRSAN
jgi:transposase-like protein